MSELAGINNIIEIVEACKERLKLVLVNTTSNDLCIDIWYVYILNADIKNASLVVLKYMLQMVPIAQRQDVLQCIAPNVNGRGVLLSRKRSERNNWN